MHELRELNPHGSLFSPDSAHKCKPPNIQQDLATRALRLAVLLQGAWATRAWTLVPGL